MEQWHSNGPVISAAPGNWFKDIWGRVTMWWKNNWILGKTNLQQPYHSGYSKDRIHIHQAASPHLFLQALRGQAPKQGSCTCKRGGVLTQHLNRGFEAWEVPWRCHCETKVETTIGRCEKRWKWYHWEAYYISCVVSLLFLWVGVRDGNVTLWKATCHCPHRINYSTTNDLKDAWLFCLGFEMFIFSSIYHVGKYHSKGLKLLVWCG